MGQGTAQQLLHKRQATGKAEEMMSKTPQFVLCFPHDFRGLLWGCAALLHVLGLAHAST